MVSAAEHSLFHFTPRGSGAVFRLKTEALALSMSSCSAVAAASRDSMSVIRGAGSFENSLLHEALNSSTMENPTIFVSSGVGRACNGIQEVVIAAWSDPNESSKDIRMGKTWSEKSAVSTTDSDYSTYRRQHADGIPRKIPGESETPSILMQYSWLVSGSLAGFSVRTRHVILLPCFFRHRNVETTLT